MSVLKIALSLFLLCGSLGFSELSEIRVLFSNDTTNLASRESPFYKRGNPVTKEVFYGSVKESADAGADVHIIQPGLSWVPWWNSSIYTAQEHYTWFQEKTGLPPDVYGKYVMEGGDIVQDIIDACREYGIKAFVSLRMNDFHAKEFAQFFDRIFAGETFDYMPRAYHIPMSFSKFYMDNPDYRLGPLPDWFEDEPLSMLTDPDRKHQMANINVQNWAIPQVRDYKFALLEELAENYDIDGFELDFMRHSRLFRLDQTTQSQRIAIMTDFIGRVRHLLDKTAKPGQRRLLCVRIPFRVAPHGDLGIDLKRWVDAGVDMVNLSCHYTTEQFCDVDIVSKMIPDTPVYLEMGYTNMRYRQLKPNAPPRSFPAYDVYRMMRDSEYYTTAHLAYQRGAAGVSLFNFHYYRGDRGGNTPPTDEEYVDQPPFHIIERLKDREWLAAQPQHYFFICGSTTPPISNNLPYWDIPGKNWFGARGYTCASDVDTLLRPDGSLRYTMDMAKPQGGWKNDGRLRVQSRDSIKNAVIAARFNGMPLMLTDDISEPYPTPYGSMGLGNEETLKAWIVPKSIIREGFNRIEFDMEKGSPVTLYFVDVSIQ